MKKSCVYPFAAVIGQEKAKRALILNAINPLIGGVLISGEKGTAKSTIVRGLESLMNDMCVVNLPLNVTGDRLLGTIDIQSALIEGKTIFEPGILKEADNNILYVDEVNLLSEHIVNCLLEVLESSENHVERECVSFSHPSRFILIGSMNPEEGNLRPLFLDRFGLYVDVEGSKDISERKEIIKRRLKYEEDAIKFILEWERETAELSDRINNAKENLKEVTISESIMNIAAKISENANCEGHRAEIVMVETARAIASFENRKYITIDDIIEAGEFALPHRMKEFPVQSDVQNKNSDNSDNNEEKNSEATSKQIDEQEECDDHEQEKNEENYESNIGHTEETTEKDELNGSEQPENLKEFSKEHERKDCYDEKKLSIEDIGRVFNVKYLDIKTVDRKKREGSGKRICTKTDLKQGRYVKYAVSKEKFADMAFDATIRAAAPYQKLRKKKNLAISIEDSDFRKKQRENRIGSTILFIVDASCSMGAKKRMAAVKGAIVSLLTDAYQKRDKVALIAFKKNDAEVLLGITRSVELAEKNLKILPTGGKTPLSAGICKGYEFIKAAKKRDKNMFPVIVLVSDGRANVSMNGGDALKESLDMARKIHDENIQSIVIDTEQDFIKLGIAKDIARAMNAKYYKLNELEADEIVGAVRQSIC